MDRASHELVSRTRTATPPSGDAICDARLLPRLALTCPRPPRLRTPRPRPGRPRAHECGWCWSVLAGQAGCHPPGGHQCSPKVREGAVQHVYEGCKYVVNPLCPPIPRWVCILVTTASGRQRVCCSCARSPIPGMMTHVPNDTAVGCCRDGVTCLTLRMFMFEGAKEQQKLRLGKRRRRQERGDEDRFTWSVFWISRCKTRAMTQAVSQTEKY